MNVSLNGLCANYYHFIRDKFSYLSPLQKKIIAVAIAFFSCVTTTYCIYRFYYFQARQIPARQNEEEDENISSSLQKKVQQPVNKTKTSEKSTQDSMQQSEIEYKAKLEEKSAQIKGIAQGTISVGDQKQVSKEIKNVANTQANQSFDNLPSIAEQDESSSTEEWSTSREEIDIYDLPSLSLLSPNLKKANQSEEIKKKKVYQPEDIEKKLEKNRKFARKQQDEEELTGFCFKMETSQRKYVKPVIVNKEEAGEMNYRQTPIENVILNKEEIKYPRVGICSCQGKRNYMEDATDVALIPLSIKEKTYLAYTFAVFDGHGGSDAASYAKENFALYLQEALAKHNEDGLTDVGIWNALKACFKSLDTAVCKDYEDGTTATVAMILEDKIWVANVGDSRTILVKDGKATQASEDAKPEIMRYKKKIEKLGGSVNFFANAYRVNGNIAVARAIGDHYIVGTNGECCVSPNPKITCYSLKDFEGGYIVAACDGLYDVAATHEVGQAIGQMASQKLSTDQMSQQLVCQALDFGATDNLSVVVVGL
jgi:serine/threonine protein phosphatase PrpC